MLKPFTVGMIEKNLKNFPDKNASQDFINGAFVGLTDTEVIPLTATTAKDIDLYVLLNTINGDESYLDTDIKKGEKGNAFLVKEWDRQYFQLNDKHLTTAYATINENDNLVANASGKLEVAASVTDYAVYFRVAKKIQFAGNGLEVQIIVA